ncbi:MAG: hypothetical protein MUE70_09405 [Desulfobacterales bacterium]|nr:hypothetical protein [Desulfobacterales bacterium]
MTPSGSSIWKGPIETESNDQAYHAILNQDFSALFHQVKTPLFIMCSHDDVLWACFPKAREAQPDADWAVVKGPDYQCTVEPGGVADDLHQFLQKHIK